MNLRSRIIAVLLTVSLLPILLMGISAWFVFGQLLERKSLELQNTVLKSHADAIESYLAKHLNSLQLLASTQELKQIAEQNTLNEVFTSLNESSRSAFEDLGVISADGNHLAYVGQYDLMGKNYREADWFKQVMLEGTYISDVFLGFRKAPHCIIAVKTTDGNQPWILRGTINSKQFDDLVSTGALGETGDVFIVNREGIYQTTSRSGIVLETSAFTDSHSFQGVQDRKVQVNSVEKIQVTTWIKHDNWLLVAEQDAAEVRAPVNRAIAKGALIVLIAVILIVVTTFLATRHLTNLVDKANAQREEIFRAFTRSAKLASVGELATGLAHEINNPLAIISADQTNISDIVLEMPEAGEDRIELLESVKRIKRQVERCRTITTKMLQFGRKSDSQLVLTNAAVALREIGSLLERQAKVRNVELIPDIEENLPDVMIDPLELEQVLVNLINNSLQALPEGGQVRIVGKQVGDEVLIEVIDTGNGIRPKDLQRIFEPFFTTKPVGEGTGLGLSVCYGIVKSWGGIIEAESEVGKGTTMRIKIPLSNDS